MLRSWIGYAYLVAGAVLILHAQELRPDQLPHSTVQLEIVDPWGKPLDKAEIQFLTVDRKRDLVKSPLSRVVSQVPYGRYLVRASVPGHNAERLILVNAEAMFVVVAVPFRWGDSAWEGGSLELVGTVVPPPRNPILVRVRGVFLDDQREASVDKAGKFSIAGLDNGAYVVEIFSGIRLLHAQSIDIDQRQAVHRLTLKLDSDPRY